MTRTRLIAFIVAFLVSTQVKASDSLPNASDLATIFNSNVISSNVNKTPARPYVARVELKVSETASRQYVFFENGEGIVTLEDGTTALLSVKETAAFFGYSEDEFKRDPVLHIRTTAESWRGITGLFNITAAIDPGLLELIDEKASLYFNPLWGLNVNQFKAWLATIAWAEGGLGGYGAHSQYGGGYTGDAFDHVVVGQSFRFSTGIGPFQLDRGQSERWDLWRTDQKLNPQLAVESAARWHRDNRPSGSTLSGFASDSPWVAVRTPSAYWSVVTGTEWSAHSGGSAPLDWSGIKNQLGANAAGYPYLSYSNNLVDRGYLTWNIKSAANLLTESGRPVVFDGDYLTLLVTARPWGGQPEVCRYYYTYRTDGPYPIEVWVWDNNWDTSNRFKYVFARECNGQFPEWRSGSSAGYPILSSPAIITGETLTVSLTGQPSSGTAPLSVDLTAEVSGTAAGTINYTFYADRSDDGTNIIPGYCFKIDGRNPDGTGGTVVYQGSATDWTGGTTFTVQDVYNYASAGTYTAKVIAERGSALPAEARITITVSAPPLPPEWISYPSTSGTGSYTVTWASSAGATSYQVERSNDQGSTWSQIYSESSTSYSESIGNGSYRYRVKATNNAGSSDWRIGTHDCLVSIPTAPNAQFTASPTVGDKPLPVQFTNQSAGDITSFSWSFGDGGTSTGQNPSYTYNSAGTYTVSLTVTGPGGSDTETKPSYIQVTDPGQVAAGSIVGWGENLYGQLDVTEPNLGFIALATGLLHSLGLKSDGSIVAWGNNVYGQLNVPSPNTGFVKIAAANTGWHSLGLKEDGSIVAWGNNAYGQLNVPSPNTGFVKIAAGSGHSLGLKSDGSIVAWGNNQNGQLNVPEPNTGFVAVAAGGCQSLALKSDGSIVKWGCGMPVPSPNTGFVAAAASDNHNLALKSDGSIVGWGSNLYGQLNVPSPNTGFIAIAAGSGHSLGLKSDGSVVAWGDNESGQLNVPSPNEGFVAIAGCRDHSLGLQLRVGTPQFIPDAGTYVSPIQVVITCATEGAAIRYTTDGSEPSESSTQYVGPIPLDTTTTLRARAWKAGWAPSEIATATYVITPSVDTPRFIPDARLYPSPIQVVITCATEGAVIRYTTDGSDPTESSTQYVQPIPVDMTTTLRARAWKEGWVPIEIATATYLIATLVKVGEARNLPDNSAVYIRDAVVTAAQLQAGLSFVESPDRSSGIKLVTDENLSVGQSVSFIGLVSRVDGEYQIADVEFIEVRQGELITPMFMTSRSVGNDRTQTLNYGGINTTGLLVTIAGEVTATVSLQGCIYVDDGVGYQDGLGPFIGIRVYIPPGVAIPAKGKRVVLAGISRVEKHTLADWGEVNGDWYPPGTVVYVPSVWLRDASDIQGVYP